MNQTDIQSLGFHPFRVFRFVSLRYEGSVFLKGPMEESKQFQHFAKWGVFFCNSSFRNAL